MEEAKTTIKPTFSNQIMNEIKDNDANKLLEISASNIESNSNCRCVYCAFLLDSFEDEELKFLGLLAFSFS